MTELTRKGAVSLTARRAEQTMHLMGNKTGPWLVAIFLLLVIIGCQPHATTSCAAGQQMCGAACVSPATDPQNCGLSIRMMTI